MMTQTVSRHQNSRTIQESRQMRSLKLTLLTEKERAFSPVRVRLSSPITRRSPTSPRVSSNVGLHAQSSSQPQESRTTCPTPVPSSGSVFDTRMVWTLPYQMACSSMENWLSRTIFSLEDKDKSNFNESDQIKRLYFSFHSFRSNGPQGWPFGQRPRMGGVRRECNDRGWLKNMGFCCIRGVSKGIGLHMSDCGKIFNFCMALRRF